MGRQQGSAEFGVLSSHQLGMLNVPHLRLALHFFKAVPSLRLTVRFSRIQVGRLGHLSLSAYQQVDAQVYDRKDGLLNGVLLTNSHHSELTRLG